MNIFAVETQTFWFALGSCASVIAALLAGFALWQASRINVAQQELATQMNSSQLKLTESIHNQQMVLAQRQAYIDIFGHLKVMPTINPQAPVWKDVVDAVNLLDLVGMAWESSITDDQMLLRSYQTIFVDTYEAIKRCKNPPVNVLKDGEAMLHDSRSATSLFNHLMDAHLNQNKVNPIKKN